MPYFSAILKDPAEDGGRLGYLFGTVRKTVDAGDTLRGVLRISGALEETHKRSLLAGSFRMKLFPSAACRLFKHISSTPLCRD
jgi:hypothetical protein